MDSRWANRINYGLAVIKMIVVFVIALGGITKYHDTTNWTTPLQQNNNSALSSYSVAITQVLFSYNGWNTLNYSLDEFRDPGRRLKKSNIF